MDLGSMKKILQKHFENIYPDISFGDAKFPENNKLLFPHLTSEEYKNVAEKLKNGDGNPTNEIYKINSSTTLAVYYFTLLLNSLGNKIKDIDFENKIGIPLNLERVRQKDPTCRLFSANIDVLYGIGNTIWFVESKFLEPYYSTTQLLSEKYLDAGNYGDNDKADIWVSYANEINNHIEEYKFYNVTQMFKHLLAMYSNLEKWDKEYSNFVLLNVGWKMTDSFKAKIESKRSLSYLIGREIKITDQTERGIKLLNKLIKELDWKNCKVEIKHYNDLDLLEKIKDSEQYGDFIKRYLIEG